MGELEERFTKPRGWITGTFRNARGQGLHYGQLKNIEKPLAHIVFIPGISEYTEKSFELARDFNEASCNFSTYDRPGQGRSPRLLKNSDGQHSQGTEHSADDLIAFCRKHVPVGEPIILLTHSTGGLIAAHAMAKAPELFRAAVMTGPLFGFHNPVLKGRESYFAHLPLPQSVSEAYIPGGGPWIARRDPASTSKPEDFSTDPARNRVHDYWTEKDPALRAGSPTCGWVKEKCRAIMRLRDPAVLKKITQPVLVFTGGQDHLVDNKAIADLVKQLPNARRVHFKFARHEMLMERDNIRDRIIHQEMLPFIKKYLP